MKLEEEIAAFIQTSAGDMEELALKICAFQKANNPVYAAIAGSVEPQKLSEIPAVPVDLFKDLELASFDTALPHTVFHTSGTTQGRPGKSYSLHTRLYDLGARLHFSRQLSSAPERIVSLCPPSGGASSLGHMVGLFGMVEPFFSLEQGVDLSVWERLYDPVFLASTAFALDILLAAPQEARLTESSLVMVTGGFKGRKSRLDAPELYRSLARLGRPKVVGEYGMTELSSQLWTDPVMAGQLPGAFIAPPWLKVLTVDPATGQPVSGVGLLRFIDLANLWSVVAIETLDIGEVQPDSAGDRVILHGRLKGAPARGCSLTAEELGLIAHPAR
jgi:hypothetical protein